MHTRSRAARFREIQSGHRIMGNEAYRPGDWHLVRGMKRPPVPYKWERAAGMGRTYSRVPTDGVTRAGEGHDAPMGQGC